MLYWRPNRFGCCLFASEQRHIAHRHRCAETRLLFAARCCARC